MLRPFVSPEYFLVMRFDSIAPNILPFSVIAIRVPRIRWLKAQIRIQTRNRFCDTGRREGRQVLSHHFRLSSTKLHAATNGKAHVDAQWRSRRASYFAPTEPKPLFKDFGLFADEKAFPLLAPKVETRPELSRHRCVQGMMFCSGGSCGGKLLSVVCLCC